MDFTTLTNEALTAALTEKREAASALFALTTPTIEQVNEAEALVASVGEIETVLADRAKAVEDAAARFAAAKATFAKEDEEDSSDEGDDKPKPFAEDADAEETVEASTEDSDDEDETTEEAPEADSTEEADATVTASVNHTNSQKVNAAATAKAVGQRTKRPAVASAKSVVITAAADIPGVPMGSHFSGLSAVATAVADRTTGFPQFNLRAAESVHSQSNGAPVLHKAAVAAFNVDFDPELRGGKGDADYNAMKAAVKRHDESLVASMNAALSGKPADPTLTAAGWCAPSEVVYNWIADYVVDGLLDQPEISAPRGGLLLTEGPQLAQTTYGGDAVDDFGFGGTEADAIAGYVKTCETIECPEFEDYRLDFDGYCWKIPILTESAYPELVADAMRLSDVLYAHKMNRRFINDTLAESTAQDASGYGGTFTDTIEALTQIAVKERRWWNLGENAIMEVKLPQHARDIFKFDMARRSGLSLDDIATDQKIAAHFANHRLAVKYISDFDTMATAAAPTPMWPANIRAIIYPSGTFVRATKPVINLSAVYDAASLSANEYTGVFFEQGVKTIRRGYRSTVVTVPVCTSGTSGANAFLCEGGSI